MDIQKRAVKSSCRSFRITYDEHNESAQRWGTARSKSDQQQQFVSEQYWLGRKCQEADLSGDGHHLMCYSVVTTMVRGGIAQWVECQTEKPGAILMGV